MSSVHCVAIFETPSCYGGDFTLTDKPVKIEFFKGTRNFNTFVQATRVVAGPGGPGGPLFGSVTLTTAPEKFYLAIYSQAKIESGDVESGLPAALSLIDIVIAKLASVFDDDLFRNQIYKGPLALEEVAIAFDLKIARTNQELSLIGIESNLAQIHQSLRADEDKRRRLILASKFYAKSLLMPFSEERFLLQWTILEIYPIRDQVKIHPLKTWISARTGKTIDEIENRMQIGRLYGQRSSLVHTGSMVSGKERHDLDEKVYRLSTEAIRDLCGWPYAGELDQFLK